MQKESKYIVADMYAQAWFAAALDNQCADAVFKEVLALKDSFEQNQELWKSLCMPVDDEHIVLPLIDEMIAKLKFSNVSAQTLRLIAENKRIGLLPLITDTFKNLYYHNKGIIEVNVDTVIELSDTQRHDLKQIMEDKLHAPVTLNYRIKPEILGGLALSFNSFLVDDTLVTKIKGLEQLIMEQE